MGWGRDKSLRNLWGLPEAGATRFVTPNEKTRKKKKLCLETLEGHAYWKAGGLEGKELEMPSAQAERY